MLLCGTARVERDRRERVDGLVLDRVDRHSHRRPRSRPLARRLRRDARRHDNDGARQPQLRHRRGFADAGPRRPAAVARPACERTSTRYGKPIVIAESQYPWTLANGDSTGNFVWQSSQVSDGYPATPGGQLSFYNDLLSILAQVPNGLGQGLFYWEPESIPGVGWEPGAGSPNDNLTCSRSPGRRFLRWACSRTRWRCALATTRQRSLARCPRGDLCDALVTGAG